MYEISNKNWKAITVILFPLFLSACVTIVNYPKPTASSNTEKKSTVLPNQCTVSTKIKGINNNDLNAIADVDQLSFAAHISKTEETTTATDATIQAEISHSDMREKVFMFGFINSISFSSD